MNLQGPHKNFSTFLTIWLRIEKSVFLHTQDYRPMDSELHWYALKVFQNKSLRMEDLLGDYVADTYVPVGLTQLQGEAHMKAARALARKSRSSILYCQKGPVIYKKEPLVAGLLFVHCSAEDIDSLDSQLHSENWLGKPQAYIFKNPERSGFAIIPDPQMKAFCMVTGQGGEGLRFLSADDLSAFKTGEKVRVTKGPFAGAEGYIKRIRKNRRLLIAIEGVVAVVTSYIPQPFLEKVTE